MYVDVGLVSNNRNYYDLKTYSYGLNYLPDDIY